MMNYSNNYYNNDDDYSVVHAMDGRIRLRIPKLAKVSRFAGELQELLSAVSWVKNFRINPAASSVVIYYSPQKFKDIERLCFQLLHKDNYRKNSDYDLVKVAENGEEKSASSSAEESWSSLALPILSTILAIASNRFNHPLLRLLARGTLITAALPVAQRAIASMIGDRKFNIDCLDLMALIFSSLQGKLVTPSLVITLHELGDLIREHTARVTEQKTANLLDTIGRFAWVKREGKIIQVTSDQVIPGETVIVHPGERIPVDGVVLKGEATIDQQQLTGESMPIVAQEGTYVYASTLLRSGQIHLECERVGKFTRAAASIELLEKAPVHDTRMANYAAQLADKLIMPSMMLAGIVFATTQDPTRTASILTLDFVTGIRVSMPTAFLGALNHTTRHGILVRSGRTMELLAEVDTIVFDKTGTLTQGDIVVVGLETVKETLSITDKLQIATQEKLPVNRVLQLAASAEQRITHPVAEAIVNYAKEQNIEILPRQEWNYVVGSGMDAEIDGLRVLVGSEKFLRSKGIVLDDHLLNNINKKAVNESLSLVFIACEGEFIGTIQYTDPLRPESADLIDKLRNIYDLNVHILTGDNQARANQVAEKLDIPLSQVHAEAFPEDKAKIVRNLGREGRVVAFVGDGLNDSVALAYADVSISFADGSDIARETADVVLMNNDLNSILEAIKIAKETQNLIEQNTMLVVAPNLIGLGFASTIGLNPLLATIIHNGTAIAAGLNSLRPLVQHQLETQTV
jgi:P-type Cu2+ transporter